MTKDLLLQMEPPWMRWGAWTTKLHERPSDCKLFLPKSQVKVADVALPMLFLPRMEFNDPFLRRKLTPPQVAQRLGINVHKVLGWIRRGELKAIDVSDRLGHGRPRWRVSVEDLEAFERVRSNWKPPERPRRQSRSDNYTRYF